MCSVHLPHFIQPALHRQVDQAVGQTERLEISLLLVLGPGDLDKVQEAMGKQALSCRAEAKRDAGRRYASRGPASYAQ